MTKTYNLRSTALASAIHVATNEVQQDTGSGAAASLSATVNAASSALTHLWTTPSTEPNIAAWQTGDYRCIIVVTAAGANLSYGFTTAGTASGHMARVDSGLTADIETKTQTEALFTGTGTKTATLGTVSWTAGAASDRWECLLACTNSNAHTNQTLTITVDDTTSFSRGDFDGAAAVFQGQPTYDGFTIG